MPIDVVGNEQSIWSIANSIRAFQAYSLVLYWKMKIVLFPKPDTWPAVLSIFNQFVTFKRGDMAKLILRIQAKWKAQVRPPQSWFFLPPDIQSSPPMPWKIWEFGGKAPNKKAKREIQFTLKWKGKKILKTKIKINMPQLADVTNQFGWDSPCSRTTIAGSFGRDWNIPTWGRRRKN